jgi:hypothetical protein
LLQGRHQGAKIAIPGEEDDVIQRSTRRMASTVSSISMLPLILRRPEASVNSLVGLVTMV